jgi:mono/diheme cytochrome c family protein
VSPRRIIHHPRTKAKLRARTILAALGLASLAISARAAGLAWSPAVIEYKAQAGEATKAFTFEVSNPSTAAITVEAVTPSCGCTVVKVPPLPWTLAPGEKGRIDASMDWRGRFGLFTKSIAVATSAGPQLLTLKIQIPAPEGVVELPIARARNLATASADRQAVFRGDCAKCHVEPAAGKIGKELYTAACGICHEAEHRATMVPDLKALPHPTDGAHWKQWITYGKPGSLMPAFAQREGGPLTDPQIDSLVEYLSSKIVSEPKSSAQDATIK